MQHQPTAIAGVQDGNGQRNLGVAGDDLAHHIGALVAKKQAAEHLNLQIGAQRQALQPLANACGQQGHIAPQVFKLGVQRKVPHHAVQRRHQRLQTAWVKRPKGRGTGHIQILGADHGPHKNKVVVKVCAVQNFGGDRVEEGLCQLGLQVPHHQADVMQLDLLPHRHGLGVSRKGLGQVLHTLLHPLVVKGHALALGALLLRPVGLLKVAFGRLGGRPEPLIVAVDAIHHRLGDVIGLWSIQSLGKHGEISCCYRLWHALRPQPR